MTEKVRIAVDKSRCDGHARCFALAPEVYPLDAEGYCALDDVLIDAALLEPAQRGAAACPEQAISVSVTSGPVGIGSMTERGLHLFELDELPWEHPAPRPGQDTRSHGAGVLEKWLVKPALDDPEEDRFPVSIIRFPPNLVFPRHWHTDGEMMLVLAGSASVGGEELPVGGLAYNDARTIYGAEAAGADGCDFLMIRRAWAKNNVMLTDEAVAEAVSSGITDSQDRLSPSVADRGLHILDRTAPFEPVGDGTDEQWLLGREAGDDRPLISVVRSPAGHAFPPYLDTEGRFTLVLEGSLVVDGAELPAGSMLYHDAGVTYGGESAGPSGCELLTVRRAPAKRTVSA
jgi:ferredoxin